METACHGLGRSDPDLPEDAPVRCFFHMSETNRPLVIDGDFAGRRYGLRPAAFLLILRLTLNGGDGYLLDSD